jgi:putative hydrolase of the HAD superfamily
MTGYSTKLDLDLMLFDLGGVLVEWEGVEPLMRLSGRSLTPEDCRRFWLESYWVRQFERGLCTPDDFAHGVIEELKFSLSPGDFLSEFLSWDRGPMPGAVELLESLQKRFTLGCLSNNNELHWSRLRDERGFLRFFEYCYVSHEMGVMKPDAGAFEHVVCATGFAVEKILYFDDNPECVDTAVSLGFQAYVTRGIDQVKESLLKLGV